MNRILSLDVLRAIAILLVLGRHAAWPESTWFGDLWHTGGWIGVDLFFVLSGFLVSRILFLEFAKHGDIDVRRFLVRRGWKIYPAFWAMVAVTALVFVGVSDIGQRVVTELLFLQGYSRTRLWAHTWSLGVEEAFYLILPVMLYFLGARDLHRLNRLVPAIMIGLLIARCLNALAPYDHQTHVFPPHLRFDSLMLGVLLAYHYKHTPAFVEFCRRHAPTLILGGGMLLLPAFFYTLETSPFLYTFGFTLNAVGCGAILMGCVCGGIADNRLTRSLAAIGMLSYSIYLWHGLTDVVLVPATGLTGWPALLCYFALSLVLGAVMARLIEQPFLALRDRVQMAAVRVS